MGYYNFGEGNGLDIVETESASEMIKEEVEAKNMNMRITVNFRHTSHFLIFIILRIILSISTIFTNK